MPRGRKRHSIPGLLKALRERKGWTLEELSKYTGIPRTTLYMYETGRTHIPAERLKALSDVYGVSIDYLVTGEDTPGQLARQYPEHFRLLNRAAKELPANRFEQLRRFMEYFIEHRGEIGQLNWQDVVEAHQDAVREANDKEK